MKPEKKLRGTKDKGNVSEVTRFKEQWLQKFSDEQKAQFFSWFDEAGTTNEEIRTRVKQRHGITLLYDTQLSDFRSWAFRQQRLDALGERMQQREAELTEQHPDWSREQIRAEVIKVAYAKALAEDDMKLGLRTVREDLRSEVVATDRERFEVEVCKKFLTWFKDKRAREIAESNMSHADQIAAMRQALFADVDELERSGAVKLPKK
jgi:hypothetical protein